MVMVEYINEQELYDELLVEADVLDDETLARIEQEQERDTQADRDWNAYQRCQAYPHRAHIPTIDNPPRGYFRTGWAERICFDIDDDIY